MYCTRKVTEDLIWVGADDRRLACFEGVYGVPDGVSYNSYLLLDEKTVLFDTVDKAVYSVFLENVAHALNGMKTHQITALGMARTFQNIRLFPEMTVLENVMIGRHCHTKAGILQALLRDRATVAEEQDTVDRSYALLETVHLAEYWDETAKNLPYGAQRRLEIARAMATEPCLLLLDEPAAGMNPQETLELKRLILSLRETHDLAVLLIEHDMSMVMSLSDRIYVMQYGSPIASGTPEEISKNPEVIKAYLGESGNA